ncbi:MAG: hypothetical protein BKP49_03650 [Treponema sp. CETP13]|nr:MAG: hypothetical protein BKP49_03650 [Treponema sp. CETP13]
MITIITDYQIQLVYLFRVFIACLCSLVIGAERKSRSKDAGPKTHFVVALSSALMMCVSISFIGDQARIAAQIIPGIGFLGAGIIFYRRENLRGLTTAAGIWGTAGIGMAIGAGLYVIGIGATVIFISGQAIMHSRVANRRAYSEMLLVKMIYNKELVKKLKETFCVEKFHRLKVSREKKEVHADVVLRTPKRFTAEDLAAFVVENPEIISIKRLEDL